MEYAISDIHGQSKTFRYLVEELLRLKQSDTLYLLGDYIDRGPDSKGVLDYIIQLKESGYHVKCLRGNHEQMLLDGRYMTDDYRMWLTNGGQATLLSFGTVRHAREIEDKYWDFLEGLEFYFELPDYFLVHAGFNFEVETKEEMLADRYSMIWARYWYDTIKMEFLDNKKIVHGHTPAPLFEIQKIVDASSNIIDIDGGCYSQRYGYGNLIALNLTSYKLIHCARIDEPLDY